MTDPKPDTEPLRRPSDILIVDDNPDNLELLASMLRPQGFSVRFATNGRRGLAAARAALPDLVLLDINMPGMDGYEVCRQLKAAEETRDVPIIFLSALDDVLDKVRAFETGGVDYICKPFELGEVLVRMENQLKLARLQRETKRQNRELRLQNEALRRSREREVTAFTALSEALPGRVLDGRYRLDEKIGSGGFGAVYRARQIALDRDVAVKVLHPLRGKSSDLERFLQEGISACRVRHPNAVAIIDSGVSEGIAFLVMELLTGRSLAAELEEVGKLPLTRAVGIAHSVCQVLIEAHEVGVVHRDIKPANIFLHHEKEQEIVKVVDFGIAKLVLGDEPCRSDSQESLVGTLHYVAPERLACEEQGNAADVYSLGITLYRALAGKLPFDTSSFGQWLIQVTDRSEEFRPLRELAPGVPPALAETIMATLARDPNLRPSAVELESSLAAFSGPQRQST